MFFSSPQIALGFERKFWGEATKEADLFGRVSRTPTVRGLFDVFYDLSRPQVRWIMIAVPSFYLMGLVPTRSDFIVCILQRHRPVYGGPVAQSVASLLADPGGVSSILSRLHTFLEIYHEILSAVILLIPLIQERLSQAKMFSDYLLSAKYILAHE